MPQPPHDADSASIPAPATPSGSVTDAPPSRAATVPPPCTRTPEEPATTAASAPAASVAAAPEPTAPAAAAEVTPEATCAADPDPDPAVVTTASTASTASTGGTFASLALVVDQGTAAARRHVLALFRAVTGLLFACHGAASLFGVLGGAHGTGGTVPAGAWPGWYAAVIQLVGGSLVLLGLGTRTAALICSGSMAYAYFGVHQPRGLWPLENGGEPAALFCWSFLLLVVSGPGALSLGARAGRRFSARSSSRTEP